MTNGELKELVHLLMMCGIMDKTALESGSVTNEEWLRMNRLIDKYQAERTEPEVQGDLISREALKKEFTKFDRIYIADTGNELVNAFAVDKLIDNAPTVDISTELSVAYLKGRRQGQSEVRPQGEWIGHERHIECNQCRVWFLKGQLIRKSFCPNCGADMRGGVE